MEHDYRERRPPAPLRSLIACTWTRSTPVGAADALVVPDACIDIIWRSDGLLQVAGPDTGPVRVESSGQRYTGVRFLPGAAPPLLGVPASAIRDLRINLADLWGRSRAEQLAAELAAAPECTEETLTRTVEALMCRVGPVDPLVDALVRRLAHTRSSLAPVATELGVSERHLRRRCEAAVGYGPKMLERVLRLQRFLNLARWSRTPLADLALAAGYADQSHLNREYRRLTGNTPGSLRRDLSPS